MNFIPEILLLPIKFIFIIAFFIGGLIINFLQFLLYFTIGFININLYRKINYYLTYSLWSHLVFIGTWWGYVDLNLYFDNEECEKLFYKSLHLHSLCLMNHTFEIDWLISWLVIEPLGKLGNAKSFVKKSLRYVPIIGWSWFFGEFAFLERSLEKDSENIIKCLKKYLQFESATSLLFFAEGTRFTKEKHEKSLEFAKQRGAPILKHHLLPRPRGFNLCVNTFKNEKQDVLLFQFQVRFPKNQSKPTFMTLFNREQIQADVYVKAWNIKDIPTDSEQATTSFLYDLYVKQDQLVDYYLENNYHFPGKSIKIKHRLYPLLIMLISLIFTMTISSYFLMQLILYGSQLAITITSLIILLAFISSYLMVRSTKIQKASSYGIVTNNDNKTKVN